MDLPGRATYRGGSTTWNSEHIYSSEDHLQHSQSSAPHSHHGDVQAHAHANEDDDDDEAMHVETSADAIVNIGFSLDWANVVQRFESKFASVYSKSKKVSFSVSHSVQFEDH
jgi:hypothetical protein